MAIYYFRNTGDVNWGTASNWSLTDGGGATGAVPTAADDALFTANSGNCTVNASNRVCKTLNFTGYTNTITMTFGITVSGAVTLAAAMGVAGTAALTVNTTATLTSNGKTWSADFTFSGTSQTYTLADNWTISGLLTFSNGTAVTVNGNTIFSSGGITTSGSGFMGGTTTLHITVGTLVGGAGSGAFGFPIVLNGNITISALSTAGTSSITYTSGTITPPTTLSLGGNVTLSTSGMFWNNVSLSATLTLSQDFNINGVLTVGAPTINGSFNINCYGGISLGNLMVKGTGNPVINLLGGTWIVTNPNAGWIPLDTNINGNITISGTVYYRVGTLRYISGTNTVTGSTLVINSSCTLNTSGMSWNNVTTSGATITLTSDLNINGLLNVAGNTLTNGSFNINVNSLFIISASVIGVNTGNPTLNFIGNGSWTGSGRLIMNTNIYGNTIISGTVSFDSRTLTNYSTNVKTINTATLNIGASSTFINCDKINFKTITITTGTTQTFNRFFSGSALIPTRIRSNTTTNYTITFQDGFEKITKFTKISNCTVSRPGQLLCITDKSNKGGNVGIRYINQSPNGIAKNEPTSPNPMAYGLPSFLDSDPNFITG
jgi:hypothetical protein